MFCLRETLFPDTMLSCSDSMVKHLFFDVSVSALAFEIVYGGRGESEVKFIATWMAELTSRQRTCHLFKKFTGALCLESLPWDMQVWQGKQTFSMISLQFAPDLFCFLTLLISLLA